jgi:hypothetical protein
MGKQNQILKEITYLSLPCGEFIYRTAIKEDRALISGQAGDNIKEGGFPCPVGAEKYQPLYSVVQWRS